MLYAAAKWPTIEPLSFGLFLGLTLVAATLKTRIPGMDGNVSPSFAFLLVGMASFSMAEVVTAGLAAALVQSLWRPQRKLQLVQVAFNAGALVISSAVSFSVSHAILRALEVTSPIALIVLAGCIYLSVNISLVATIVALVEGRSPGAVWQDCHASVFPCFLVGITLVGLLAGYATSTPWQQAVCLLPAVILGHLYFSTRRGDVLAAQRAIGK